MQQQCIEQQFTNIDNWWIVPVNVGQAQIDDRPATAHVGALLSAPTWQSRHCFVEKPPAFHAQSVHSGQHCTAKHTTTALTAVSFRHVNQLTQTQHSV